MANPATEEDYFDWKENLSEDEQRELAWEEHRRRYVPCDGYDFSDKTPLRGS